MKIADIKTHDLVATGSQADATIRRVDNVYRKSVLLSWYEGKHRCQQEVDPSIVQPLSVEQMKAAELYANRLGYSDVTPFEVIRVVSGKTLEVRAMKYEKDDSVELNFDVGGFAAHCSNQNEQRWHISSDESERVVRIRLNKSGWQDAHGNFYDLSVMPRRFYDYNF